MENQTTTPTLQNVQSAPIAAATARSEFTGGAFANFFINLLTKIVSVITLGLAYPAMSCWKLRWETRHTFINGRQLTFDGKALQLFGKFIVWLLLSVITFGIYYIVAMRVGIIKWQTKHTHISGEEGKESSFDGHWYQLLGWNIVHGIVFAVTFTLGLYWIHCHTERWYCKHKIIDGNKLTFDGKAIQYFGKCICWVLLTVITIGIYGFWLTVKSVKWTVSHTHFENPEFIAAPHSADAASAPQTGLPAAAAPADRAYVQAAQPAYAPSNICAIIGFIMSFMPYLSILAIIFSSIGLSKPKQRGFGFAVAGLIISLLSIVMIVIYIIVFVAVTANSW